MNNSMCLFLSCEHLPIAKGMIEGPTTGESIQILVLDKNAEMIKNQEVVEVVDLSGGGSYRCCFARQKEDRVVLKKMMTLDPELRRSLRIPVRFQSFLYPIAHEWRGRKEIESIDLSCGGIAFYGNDEMHVGDRAEVVIPITANPLIVRIELLRKQELKNGRAYYTAKFADLCDGEEHMICEAVFSIQLQNRPKMAELDGMED